MRSRLMHTPVFSLPADCPPPLSVVLCPAPVRRPGHFFGGPRSPCAHGHPRCPGMTDIYNQGGVREKTKRERAIERALIVSAAGNERQLTPTPRLSMPRVGFINSSPDELKKRPAFGSSLASVLAGHSRRDALVGSGL